MSSSFDDRQLSLSIRNSNVHGKRATGQIFTMLLPGLSTYPIQEKWVTWCDALANYYESVCRTA